MAWPFDGDQSVGTCVKMYGRQRSCLGPWTRDQQVLAGLVLLVAVGNFAVKVRSCLCTRSGCHGRHSHLMSDILLLKVSNNTNRLSSSYFTAAVVAHGCNRFAVDMLL